MSLHRPCLDPSVGCWLQRYLLALLNAVHQHNSRGGAAASGDAEEAAVPGGWAGLIRLTSEPGARDISVTAK